LVNSICCSRAGEKIKEVLDSLWPYVGSYEIQGHQYYYVLDEVGSRLGCPTPPMILQEALSSDSTISADEKNDSPAFAMALVLTRAGMVPDGPVIGYSAAWPRRAVEEGEEIDCFNLPHSRGLDYCLEDAVREDDDWIESAPSVIVMVDEEDDEDEDTGSNSDSHSSPPAPSHGLFLLQSIKSISATLKVGMRCCTHVNHFVHSVILMIRRSFHLLAWLVNENNNQPTVSFVCRAHQEAGYNARRISEVMGVREEYGDVLPVWDMSHPSRRVVVLDQLSRHGGGVVGQDQRFITLVKLFLVHTWVPIPEALDALGPTLLAHLVELRILYPVSRLRVCIHLLLFC